VLRDFEESDTERPNIRVDAISLASDSLRRHIVGSADKSVSLATSSDVATNTKIAELHLAAAGEKNVGRLDICWQVSLVSAFDQCVCLPLCKILQLCRYVRPLNPPSATFPSGFSPILPPRFFTSR
jgi:hypothetical protein